MGDVSIPRDEFFKLYLFISDLHHFLHQPLNYPDIQHYADRHYPDLRELYYKIIPGWLSEEQEEEFLRILDAQADEEYRRVLARESNQEPLGPSGREQSPTDGERSED